MKDELVSYETAKLAKEKGFDIEVNGYYNFLEPDIIRIAGAANWNYYSWGHTTISAPTQSLLQRWLREKHNIDIRIQPPSSDPGTYVSEIFEKRYSLSWGSEHYDTYEAALEAGLQHILKQIDDVSH